MTSKTLQGSVTLFVFGIVTALMSQQGGDWETAFVIISGIIWVLFALSIIVLMAERKKQKQIAK